MLSADTRCGGARVVWVVSSLTQGGFACRLPFCQHGKGKICIFLSPTNCFPPALNIINMPRPRKLRQLRISRQDTALARALRKGGILLKSKRCPSVSRLGERRACSGPENAAAHRTCLTCNCHHAVQCHALCFQPCSMLAGNHDPDHSAISRCRYGAKDPHLNAMPWIVRPLLNKLHADR